MVMSKLIFPDYACLIMPRERPGAPERHRTPFGRATAPRPPQLPWVTPAKKRAPKPNSASRER